MAHFLGTTRILASKKHSTESAGATFKAKVTTGNTEITGVNSFTNVKVGSFVKQASILPKTGAYVTSVNEGAKTAVLTVIPVNEPKKVAETGATQPAFSGDWTPRSFESVTTEFTFEVERPFVYTSFPAQVDWSEFISGDVTSDQEGKLEVQQTFDLPTSNKEGKSVSEWAEEAHWDTVTEVKAAAGKKEVFQIFGVGPYFRLVYTNGETDQTEFRLYARAFERGRI